MKTFLFWSKYANKFLLKRAKPALLFMALSSLLFISSCSDDDKNEARKYDISVIVNYPDGYNENSKSGITVKSTSAQTGVTTSAETDASGVAQFSLIAGVYNFTVAETTEEFAFNGLLESITISEDQAILLNLQASVLSGGLVFKELYYAGSKTPEGGNYYSDQFFEIYNNSDEIIYLDNVGFGALSPTTSNTPSKWVDSDGNLIDKLALWGYSFYIKGSGTDYPLEPRTSIVIAQDGIDHKTDPLGNPGSPVNLGNATWETYVGDVNGGKDADAAAVPNIPLLYATSTTAVDALYSVFGPAMVIFRFPADIDPLEFVSDDSNLSTEPGSSSSTRYPMIPKQYVLDIVECVNSDESKRYKRVPSDLDAGYTYISEGSYSSMSIRRKVKQVIDGKVIYQNTNNSTEDFLTDQVPSPFVHPTTVDN